MLAQGMTIFDFCGRIKIKFDRIKITQQGPRMETKTVLASPNPTHAVVIDTQTHAEVARFIYPAHVAKARQLRDRKDRAHGAVRYVVRYV